MAERDRYQLEIEQERKAKRAKMVKKTAIIARVKKTHDSTDLSNDDLFLEIYEALVAAGLDVHETDTNRYLGIQKKERLSRQQEVV